MTFAERLKAFLEDRGLSYSQATIKTGGRIKRYYWSPLTNGSQTPTPRVMEILDSTFRKEAPHFVLELWQLTPFRPPADLVAMVEGQTRADLATLSSEGADYIEKLEAVASLRNVSEEEVLPLLLREELERLKGPKGLKGLKAVNLLAGTGIATL